MAKIALRFYNREIENLIERGQTEEAIAHCKYILQTYPKHIETYRLLGKAFLESQRYGEAADIFQRIITTVPEDFVAHVGMSIIRENEGNLDESIWHMERAFEVQPSNVAVQEELRRLYGRRDGFEPPRIRLTRGALVRMYARGDLYQQAIAEIRAAIAEEPIRPDLQVLLARMCLLAGQRIESTEICSDLLGKFPYCYEANRILAEILPGTTRAEDAKVYLQRIYSLDPYASLTTVERPNPLDVPDNAITIERMEWQLPSQTESARQQWTSALGVNLADIESETQGVPDWLKPTEETVAPVAKAPATFVPTETPSLQAESLPAEEEALMREEETGLPDWMLEAGWQAPTGEGEGQAGAPIKELSEEEEIAPAAIPEWLQSMAPPGMTKEAEVSEEEIKAFEELFAKTGTLPEGPLAPEELKPSDKGSEVPEWLKDTGPLKAIKAGMREEGVAPATDVPEWLKDIQQPAQAAAAGLAQQPPKEGAEQMPFTVPEASVPPAVTPALTEAPAEELPEGELPDWLKSMARPAEAAAAAATPLEEIPEWLKEIQEPAKAPTEAEAQPSEGFPEWLKEAEKTPVEGIGMPPPAVELSQTAILGEEIPELMEEGVPPEETPLAEAPVLPEVPSTLPSPGTVPLEEDATFAWLESLAAKQGAAEETLFVKPEERVETPPEWVQQAAAEQEGAGEQVSPVSELPPEAELPQPGQTAILSEEVPEWLKEAEGTPEIEVLKPAETTEEVPDWLKEAAAAASTQPAAASEVEVTTPAEEEDAFAWLESLAARQGAAAETLFVKPEDRTEVAPEWVQKAAEEAPEEIPQAPEPQPGQTAILGEETGPLEEAAPEAITEVIEPQAGQTVILGEETGWLEEAEAAPEAITEVPEPQAGQTIILGEETGWEEELEAAPEVLPQAPDTLPGQTVLLGEDTGWMEETTAALTPEAGPVAPVEAPPEAAAISEGVPQEQPVSEVNPPKTGPLPPEWFEKVEEFTGIPTAESPQPASLAEELPDWMKETEGLSETAPVSAAPAPGSEELPEWLKEMEEVAPSQPSQPAVELPEWLQGVEAEQTPATISSPTPVPYEEENMDWLTEVTQPVEKPIQAWMQEAEKPVEELPITHGLVEPVITLPPIKDETEASEVLSESQAALIEGKINLAIQGYSRLISANSNIEEAIHDLRDALYRFPVDVSIWQTLGDAYVRSNRLQDGLNAYTKAEELLR